MKIKRLSLSLPHLSLPPFPSLPPPQKGYVSTEKEGGYKPGIELSEDTN